MGIVKVKSVLSYGALCGSAFWALTQSYAVGTEDYWTCSNVGFALITLHGIFGFWRYGRCSTNARIPKFYKPLSLITNIYSVPLICVDMYLFNNFGFEYAYLHLIYPILAMFSYLKKKRADSKTVDLVNFMSLTSFSFISAMSKNYHGLCAAVTHVMAHYAINRAGKTLGLDSRDGENYIMALFVFFSLKALVIAEQKWLTSNGGSRPLFSCWGK